MRLWIYTVRIPLSSRDTRHNTSETPEKTERHGKGNKQRQIRPGQSQVFQCNLVVVVVRPFRASLFLLRTVSTSRERGARVERDRLELISWRANRVSRGAKLSRLQRQRSNFWCRFRSADVAGIRTGRVSVLDPRQYHPWFQVATVVDIIRIA